MHQLRPEFLDPQFWEKNSNRFLAFALSCMSRRKFRGSYLHGPAGAEAHDYVTSAAMLILDGTRRCPEHVSPVVFVLGVIRSLVSHAGETRENRSAHESIVDESRIGDGVVADELEANELAQKFLQAVPTKYRRYVKLLMSGLHQTAEDRATAMGVSVEKIRLLDKAVRRLRSQWEGREPPVKKRRK